MDNNGILLLILAFLLSKLLPSFCTSIENTATYRTRQHNHRRLVSYFTETADDAFQVSWAHNVNSWSALSDIRTSSVKVVQGDVIMGANGIPCMAYPAERNNSITLKRWLKEVALMNKGIKLVFHRTNVIKPSLDYLFSAKAYITKPVLIHAEILPGPNSEIASGELVDAPTFISQATSVFPWGYLSVSWLTDIEKEGRPRDYNWRDILDMLELVYEVRQPVVFNFRAIYVKSFLGQLMWLLTARHTFSLSIYGSELDMINEWQTLVGLRLFADRDRVFYDLPEMQRDLLAEQYKQMIWTKPKLRLFSRKSWRIINFINSDATLSTIIASEYGAAFVGLPTAFLLAQSSPSPLARSQMITGRILSVPKKQFRADGAIETGMSIYLLPSVEDIASPLLQGGLRIFIGYEGTIFIQNREATPELLKRGHYYPQVFAKLAQHNCYVFNVEDTRFSVTLTVYASRYCNGANESMPQKGTYRQIYLKTPSFQRQYRHVILQKSGDSNMDFIVENLAHLNGGSSDRNCLLSEMQLRLTLFIATVFLSKSIL